MFELRRLFELKPDRHCFRPFSCLFEQFGSGHIRTKMEVVLNERKEHLTKSKDTIYRLFYLSLHAISPGIAFCQTEITFSKCCHPNRC